MSVVFNNYITIRNGFFFDEGKNDFWIPKGVAYQSWIDSFGVWQTREQISYDLDQIVLLGSDSIRVDIIWQNIEPFKGQYDWSNVDYLIEEAEKRGLRIFALIVHQWPPKWFEEDCYTKHPPGVDKDGNHYEERWTSDIVSFYHPDSRRLYAAWVRAVCDRYKDHKSVAGWILGNELGYLGLWSLLPDGFDDYTEEAFREWCARKYETIDVLNKCWRTSYHDFSEIQFEEKYSTSTPASAIRADMTEFFEEGVAEFVVPLARIAKETAPHHLISYSTVGTHWGQEDWSYHFEDRRKIAQRCREQGVPLDFFSANNYPWPLVGSEMRSVTWAVRYTEKTTGLPVLVTEYGYTSTQPNQPPMTPERQADLNRNLLWEGLVNGVMGNHIFTLQDREWISERETGFGLTFYNRFHKAPYASAIHDFLSSGQLSLEKFLPHSKTPKAKIAFLYTQANHPQCIRYKWELMQLSGALQRAGFYSDVMDADELIRGNYKKYELIILPRNERMECVHPAYPKSLLTFIREEVLPLGIHVWALTDIPGIRDEYGYVHPEALSEIEAIFGVDVKERETYEAIQSYKKSIFGSYNPIKVFFEQGKAADREMYEYHAEVWKYHRHVHVTSGECKGWFIDEQNRDFASRDEVHRPYGWELHGTTGVTEGEEGIKLFGQSELRRSFLVAPEGDYWLGVYARSGGAFFSNHLVLGLKWYDMQGNLLHTNEKHFGGLNNEYQYYRIDAFAPAEAYYAEQYIRYAGDPGSFAALRHESKHPAMVLKDHGSAKACITLYVTGDIFSTAAHHDYENRNVPWEWRFRLMNTVVRDYFGMEPDFEVLGEEAGLILPNYIEFKDGSVLLQLRSLYYSPVNNPARVFTIKSKLLMDKYILNLNTNELIVAGSQGISLALRNDEQILLWAAPGERPRNPAARFTSVSRHFYACDSTKNECAVYVDDLPDGDFELQLRARSSRGNEISLSSVRVNNARKEYKISFSLFNENVRMLLGDVSADYIWLKLKVVNPKGGTITESAEEKVLLGILLSRKEEHVCWQDLPSPLSWDQTPMKRTEVFENRIAIYRSLATRKEFGEEKDKSAHIAQALEDLGYKPANPLQVRLGEFVCEERNGKSGKYSVTALTQMYGGARLSQKDSETLISQIGSSANQFICWDCEDSDYKCSIRFSYEQFSRNSDEIKLLFRYQDRFNYSCISILKDFTRWHIRYSVMSGGSKVVSGLLADIPDQDFIKEKEWHELSVTLDGNEFEVRFDNEVIGNCRGLYFEKGCCGIELTAPQLGPYLPANKSYSFVDDDEANDPVNGNTGFNYPYYDKFFQTIIMSGPLLVTEKDIQSIKAWSETPLRHLIFMEESLSYNGVRKDNEQLVLTLTDLTAIGDTTRVSSLWNLFADKSAVKFVYPEVFHADHPNYFIGLSYKSEDSLSKSLANALTITQRLHFNLRIEYYDEFERILNTEIIPVYSSSGRYPLNSIENLGVVKCRAYLMRSSDRPDGVRLGMTEFKYELKSYV